MLFEDFQSRHSKFMFLIKFRGISSKLSAGYEVAIQTSLTHIYLLKSHTIQKHKSKRIYMYIILLYLCHFNKYHYYTTHFFVVEDLNMLRIILCMYHSACIILQVLPRKHFFTFLVILENSKNREMLPHGWYKDVDHDDTVRIWRVQRLNSEVSI